jgi:hypothetical protein
LPPVQLVGVLKALDVFAAIWVNDGQLVAGSPVCRAGLAPDELTAALEEKHHKRANLLPELTESTTALGSGTARARQPEAQVHSSERRGLELRSQP